MDAAGVGPAACEMDVLPTPNFEGSEKRVEMDFAWRTTAGVVPCPRGLRALPRESLDELMRLAACCIVSSRSNDDLDAYVLSESSLFVYPTKWVLKTCGTTKLLDSIPRLLELAADLGMVPRRVKYTRASFLFPEQQPFPYTSFEHEVALLNTHFGGLGPEGGRAYLLGHPSAGLQWHVYLAEEEQQPEAAATALEPTAAAAAAPASVVASAASVLANLRNATYGVEVCMTELDPAAANQFCRTEVFVSASATTASSGIGALLKPTALVDDYVFEPCGYSMNGIDAGSLCTIHITPEPGQSYASVEMCAPTTEQLPAPSQLLRELVKIFRPSRMAVTLSAGGGRPEVAGADADAWGALTELPTGYGCSGASQQQHGAGRVTFYTLVAGQEGGAAAAVGMGKATGGLQAPTSPVSALHLHSSFLSMGASDSDDGREYTLL